MDKNKNQIYDDAKELIENLAKALNAKADELFEVLVRQSFIDAIYYIVMFISFIVLATAIFKYFYPMVKKLDEVSTYIDELLAYISIIVMSLIALTLLIITLANFDIIIGGLLNPEYLALKKIFPFIK